MFSQRTFSFLKKKSEKENWGNEKYYSQNNWRERLHNICILLIQGLLQNKEKKKIQEIISSLVSCGDYSGNRCAAAAWARRLSPAKQ